MIFLDNNSTTPLDKRVKAVMEECLANNFGNPHSAFHQYGTKASLSIQKSRKVVADFFGVESDFVVFNSGATEANNQFIIGAAKKALKNKSNRKKIFCSSVEHKCVLNAAESTAQDGFEFHEIPVNKEGTVDLEFLKKNVDEDTLLISVMAVNNETGCSSPLKQIGEIAKKSGVLFHSDFAQALFSKWDNISSLQLDAISISGHKINGPKGVGALICTSLPTDLVEPIIYGGLQEAGLRSGTVPVFLVEALAKAIEIIDEERDAIYKHLKSLKENFLNALSNKKVPFELNNVGAIGHPGTLNLFFPGIEAEMLCAQLANSVALSSAAACNGLKNEYSYVLKNMGYSDDRASSSIRLCFGMQNSFEECEAAALEICNKVNEIKEF